MSNKVCGKCAGELYTYDGVKWLCIEDRCPKYVPRHSFIDDLKKNPKPVSRRDQFAMAAITGLCANPSKDFSAAEIIETAFLMADGAILMGDK